MEKVTLNVEGMSCSHCEHAVKTAVGALDGVASVEVSLAEKKVTVEYDAGKVSTADFKLAIEDEGYDVV
ncbi:MAG: copper chaperone CopZ [Eubacteriales bacterium]